MKLYALPQSPYCAKVRAALRYKGVPYEEVEPHGGSYQTTEFQSVVPAGSVPALEENHWLLHDSQAILEYLEECYPDPPLWSPERRQRAVQRSIVHFHDTKLEPKVRELVSLVKQPDSAAKEQDVGLIRDSLFDRLYRLEKLLIAASDKRPNALCAVDWTLPPTIHMAEDILAYLNSSLKISDQMRSWLDRQREIPLVTDEIDCVRGAIAQWLRNEMAMSYQA
ncbi:MAG: glutathione S-transferase family protein [Acidiferrobacterales bacterium]|nr:glutathione S-transferase family protein [Acidiferrobacterales bacterium]